MGFFPGHIWEDEPVQICFALCQELLMLDVCVLERMPAKIYLCHVSQNELCVLLKLCALL